MRAHLEVVQRLLAASVPEVAAGRVTVRAVAREPGVLTKVALEAHEAGLDPVEVCRGPRGEVQQAVAARLGDRAIDLVAWAADPALFARRAVARAVVVQAIVNEAGRAVELIVPDEHLRAAIGDGGVNVRLAAVLLDWKLSVRGASAAAAARAAALAALARLPGVDAELAERLFVNGFRSPAQIATADEQELLGVHGILPENLEALRAAARALAGAE